MKKLVVLFCMMMISLSCFSQKDKWFYFEEDNPFNGGKRHFAAIQGIGSEWTDEPIIAFALIPSKSTQIQLMIGGLGFVCSNPVVKFSFDYNPADIIQSREIDISISKNHDAVVMRTFESALTYWEYDIEEIIERMKSSNTLMVRVSDDCDTKDYEFSLYGSIEIISKLQNLR